MRISRLTLAAAGLALPAILAAQAGAAGPNYVANGDFSQGLAGWPDWDWQKSNVTVTADEKLSIESKLPVAQGTYDSTAQCLAIPSDQHSYLVEAELLLPAGQGRNGYLNIVVQSYEGPCEAPGQPTYIGSDEFYGAGTPHQASFEVTPLAGATHLRVKVGVGTGALQAGQDPNATLEAFFDNVSITAIDYEPPADDPTPPADDPTPPADDPTPPADDPAPPADDPSLPVDHSDPPVDPSPQTTPAANPETPAGEPGPGDSYEQVAPAPPSTGTGLSTDAANSFPLIAGLALTAAASVLGAFAAAGARMTRR